MICRTKTAGILITTPLALADLAKVTLGRGNPRGHRNGRNLRQFRRRGVVSAPGDRQRRQNPNTRTNRYTFTFPAGQFPPADGFWSVWLPAPNGPIYVVVRVCSPKEMALDGS
jgi:Protein of unknown function (DUF1214)